MICPHCQTPMTDAMIGVTIAVYHGPTENQMVRGWVCSCGVRLWRDELVRLPRLRGEQRVGLDTDTALAAERIGLEPINAR